MTEEYQAPPGLVRVLMTEEAIYGLILVSGMLVVSGTARGTAVNALLTVAVTVLVFFAAHVYAGTLSRLAATEGRAGMRASIRGAARQSAGMLIASVPPLIVLALGATALIPDAIALWVALGANTASLAVLGWIAVARWSRHWTARLLGAGVTAAFGGALILLKAIVTH